MQHGKKNSIRLEKILLHHFCHWINDFSFLFFFSAEPQIPAYLLQNVHSTRVFHTS